MQKLSDVIDSIMKPLCKDFGAVKIKIFLHWEEIVGSDIAKIVMPHKISIDAQSNLLILYLLVNNSAFATKVYFLIPTIMEKVTVFLGYKALSEIKIKQCF